MIFAIKIWIQKIRRILISAHTYQSSIPTSACFNLFCNFCWESFFDLLWVWCHGLNWILLFYDPVGGTGPWACHTPGSFISVVTMSLESAVSPSVCLSFHLSFWIFSLVIMLGFVKIHSAMPFLFILFHWRSTCLLIVRYWVLLYAWSGCVFVLPYIRLCYKSLLIIVLEICYVASEMWTHQRSH